MLVKNFTEYDFLEKYSLLNKDVRILNAGSSSVRYGDNCVNIDIQAKPNVDIVCDIHSLPSSLGKFDVIILNAVLQYCHSPQLVAEELYKALNDGGYLFCDAPWIQSFCPDTPDRYRFSEDALKSIFSNFTIVDSGPSIRPGSAFSMYGIDIARSLTMNKYINFVLGKIATVLLYPFTFIRTSQENKIAGAFYIICKKDVLIFPKKNNPQK